MITSSDSSLIIRLERAAFSLAEEYEANALRRHELPIGEMGDPLSVAAIAQILLALPREVAVRSLTSSLENQYGNIYETLVGQWCILRQRLEEGEDEKENAPPSFSMPTPLPEGRSASSVSFSPRVLPSILSTEHIIPTSPILDPSSSPGANSVNLAILSTSAVVLSLPEPAPSDHPNIVTILPSTFEDIPLVERPSAALFENLAVAPEEDVPGPPTCSAHLPGKIPTQGEDTQSPHTASSPSLLSRSSLSSPQPCSSSV